MPRPKQFDQTAVLHKAMLLFWEKGYYNTSVDDLVKAMGIHRRSLYDTFGSKYELFVQGLQMYVGLVPKLRERWLQDIASPKAALREMFVRMSRTSNSPPGCLVVNTATELAHHDAQCAEMVRESMARTEQFIAAQLARAQELGEIPAERDVQQLTAYLNNALVGIRVMVKARPPQQQIDDLIDVIMAGLE